MNKNNMSYKSDKNDDAYYVVCTDPTHIGGYCAEYDSYGKAKVALDQHKIDFPTHLSVGISNDCPFKK